MENKTEIMAQIVALLTQLIDNDTEIQNNIGSEHSAESVEMLTVKECTQAIKGLSEHTVRQLVAQKKIPYIRTGQGKRGKILISKAALLEYLGGAA
ncbi:MAG: helix-turn-helix domain-containing protein [Ruminococcus sp.]|nr:helix-turn-helix domain-containing protein [Ruminococcus sp.]